MRKPIAIVLILILLTATASLAGCSMPGSSDAEPTLAVTTPTPTTEAAVTPGDATPTTAPDRFPNRANADTGNGTSWRNRRSNRYCSTSKNFRMCFATQTTWSCWFTITMSAKLFMASSSISFTV